VKDRAPILEALKHPNVQAGMAVIRTAEGTFDEDGYRRHFGGELFDISNGWQHPHKAITKKHGKSVITSTAAGAGQFLSKTWRGLQAQYDIPDFSPAWQDFGIVALIAGRGALNALIAGRFDEFITRCNREWASLPGSPYGQPTISLERAREIFYLHGGTVADPAELPKGSPMSPLVIPILQTLASSLPALAKMFGSGSEVANRNIAAGQIIADKIVEVTQAVNLQEAAEKIQSNPEALQAAKQVVAETVMALSEAGGGGIDGAGKRNAAVADIPLYRDRAFIVACMFFPLIAAVVFAALFKFEWLAEITPETRSMVIGFVMGTVAGAIIAFFFGTSQSSRNKDSALLGRQP
jgi:muramidase (phage lysozyme)